MARSNSSYYLILVKKKAPSVRTSISICYSTKHIPVSIDTKQLEYTQLLKRQHRLVLEGKDRRNLFRKEQVLSYREPRAQRRQWLKRTSIHDAAADSIRISFGRGTRS